MRIAGTIKASVVDGPGLRYVIFVQGCPHHCKGCHNPQTWDAAGGYEVSPEDIIKNIPASLSGVTFSGGEPFEQQGDLIRIADWAHMNGMNVWCYTGYLYEKIKGENLAKAVDVIIDGPFVQELKCSNLPFRGSSNQKIIRLNTQNTM